MKIKLFFAGILITLFSFFMFSQVNFVMSQEARTDALTAPLTYIRGTVLYKFLSWYKPASSAKVKAQHVATRKEYTASVDKYGKYEIGVDQMGQYKVRAYDDKGTVFLPLSQLVEIIDKDVSGINFQGFLRF